MNYFQLQVYQSWYWEWKKTITKKTWTTSVGILIFYCLLLNPWQLHCQGEGWGGCSTKGTQPVAVGNVQTDKAVPLQLAAISVCQTRIAEQGWWYRSTQGSQIHCWWGPQSNPEFRHQKVRIRINKVQEIVTARNEAKGLTIKSNSKWRMVRITNEALSSEQDPAAVPCQNKGSQSPWGGIAWQHTLVHMAFCMLPKS